MKLHAFHATDGDCLLVESAKGRRVLVDGGRAASFAQCSQPVLDAMVANDEALDLIIVSHIDADHISGIVPLLDAYGQWTAFEHRLAVSPPDELADVQARPPKVPKQPKIEAVWHNSWRNQLGRLADPAGNLAQAIASAVSVAFGDSGTEPLPARAMANLAESMEQGEDLMDLIDGNAVPIAFNAPFDGLVRLRKPIHVEKFGKLKISVLGPMNKHLKTLREEWQAWVDGLPAAAAGGRRSRGRAGPGEAVDEVPLETAVANSVELIEALTAAAEIIASADASKVTPPNRASIIVLAEEDRRTCLLTGDAAEPEILDGLKAAKLLGREPFRCNVLKVQHHGSEHNLSAEFAERVLAEQYVFSGDGASGNPDPSVVRTIVETRFDTDPATPFTLWFTSSETRPTSAKKRAVMRDAIAEAVKGADDHPDAITVRVLGDDETVHIIDV